MELKINWRVGLLIAGPILFFIYVYWSWSSPGSKIFTSFFVEAEQPKVAAQAERKSVEVDAVSVIEKEDIKKIALPARVIKDNDKAVTSIVDVPPTKGGATAAAVLDIPSGKTTIIVKENTLPLLGLERTNAVGVRYGLSTANRGYYGDIHYQRDILRIGNVHIGPYFEVNTAPEVRALIQAELRW